MLWIRKSSFSFRLSNQTLHLDVNFRNYGLMIEDEFQLDDGIISGSFDQTFDMGIVGTSSGSLWYICWRTDRSKTRLLASHTDQITGILPIENTHLVTSSLDGTIRVFQIEDRNEILRFHIDGLVCFSSFVDSNTISIFFRKSLVYHRGTMLFVLNKIFLLPTPIPSRISKRQFDRFSPDITMGPYEFFICYMDKCL